MLLVPGKKIYGDFLNIKMSGYDQVQQLSFSHALTSIPKQGRTWNRSHKLFGQRFGLFWRPITCTCTDPCTHSDALSINTCTLILVWGPVGRGEGEGAVECVHA